MTFFYAVMSYVHHHSQLPCVCVPPRPPARHRRRRAVCPSPRNRPTSMPFEIERRRRRAICAGVGVRRTREFYGNAVGILAVESLFDRTTFMNTMVCTGKCEKCTQGNFSTVRFFNAFYRWRLRCSVSESVNVHTTIRFFGAVCSHSPHPQRDRLTAQRSRNTPAGSPKQEKRL
ncbi:hypothetical protein EVAR_47269_1 [Eumeta japonica]|uniref:Uncharacterized protein n=1 Tax=Eumeta variegata TaxID=151549 RepID=A0A4C1XIR2_EUMVA|nr:hypothetical protein EVAR_47269_1 [Eumeta japonica]